MPEKKKEKPIHADHRARMQERVRRDGIESLAEHEALEYLLFFAIPRKDTNELAHRLLNHFGGFCRVLEASEEQLLEVDGIGPTSARMVHSILEFSRYYSLGLNKIKHSLKQSDDAMDYCKQLFIGMTQEVFYVIAMDERLYPVRTMRIAEGVPNRVQIDTASMMRKIIASNCSCVILTHNHPGGLPVPSAADIMQTEAIMRLLSPLHITVIDHIIVAGSEAYSMRRKDRLPILR